MALVGGNKLKKMLEEIKQKASNTSMAVGIPEGATSSEGESIPEYAAENEYGGRPFMQLTADKFGKDWSKKVGRLISNQNWDFVSALNVVGDIAAKDMMETIQTYPKSPPNSPATIAIKKEGGYNPFDQPLVHTGDMLRAVAFEVTE